MLPRTQRQKEVLDYITRFLAKHGHRTFVRTNRSSLRDQFKGDDREAHRRVGEAGSDQARAWTCVSRSA